MDYNEDDRIADEAAERHIVREETEATGELAIFDPTSPAPLVGSDSMVVLGLTTAMDNYQRHWQQLAKVSYKKANHYENMEGTQAALIGARHRQVADAYEHCRAHIQRLLAAAKKRQPQHNNDSAAFVAEQKK